MNWQPIETARIEPFNKDKWFKSHSLRMLLWTGYVQIGCYEYTERGKGRWISYLGVIKPTHWMPIPDAPDEAAP